MTFRTLTAAARATVLSAAVAASFVAGPASAQMLLPWNVEVIGFCFLCDQDLDHYAQIDD